MRMSMRILISLFVLLLAVMLCFTILSHLNPHSQAGNQPFISTAPADTTDTAHIRVPFSAPISPER